jgi:hypothetical protein
LHFLKSAAEVVDLKVVARDGFVQHYTPLCISITGLALQSAA